MKNRKLLTSLLTTISITAPLGLAIACSEATEVTAENLQNWDEFVKDKFEVTGKNGEGKITKFPTLKNLTILYSTNGIDYSVVRPTNMWNGDTLHVHGKLQTVTPGQDKLEHEIEININTLDALMAEDYAVATYAESDVLDNIILRGANTEASASFKTSQTIDGVKLSFEEDSKLKNISNGDRIYINIEAQNGYKLNGPNRVMYYARHIKDENPTVINVGTTKEEVLAQVMTTGYNGSAYASLRNPNSEKGLRYEFKPGDKRANLSNGDSFTIYVKEKDGYLLLGENSFSYTVEELGEEIFNNGFDYSIATSENISSSVTDNGSISLGEYIAPVGSTIYYLDADFNKHEYTGPLVNLSGGNYKFSLELNNPEIDGWHGTQPSFSVQVNGYIDNSKILVDGTSFIEGIATQTHETFSNSNNGSIDLNDYTKPNGTKVFYSLKGDDNFSEYTSKLNDLAPGKYVFYLVLENEGSYTWSDGITPKFEIEIEKNFDEENVMNMKNYFQELDGSNSTLAGSESLYPDKLEGETDNANIGILEPLDDNDISISYEVTDSLNEEGKIFVKVSLSKGQYTEEIDIELNGFKNVRYVDLQTFTKEFVNPIGYNRHGTFNRESLPDINGGILVFSKNDPNGTYTQTYPTNLINGDILYIKVDLDNDFEFRENETGEMVYEINGLINIVNTSQFRQSSFSFTGWNQEGEIVNDNVNEFADVQYSIGSTNGLMNWSDTLPNNLINNQSIFARLVAHVGAELPNGFKNEVELTVNGLLVEVDLTNYNSQSFSLSGNEINPRANKPSIAGITYKYSLSESGNFTSTPPNVLNNYPVYVKYEFEEGYGHKTDVNIPITFTPTSLQVIDYQYGPLSWVSWETSSENFLLYSPIFSDAVIGTRVTRMQAEHFYKGMQENWDKQNVNKVFIARGIRTSSNNVAPQIWGSFTKGGSKETIISQIMSKTWGADEKIGVGKNSEPYQVLSGTHGGKHFWGTDSRWVDVGWNFWNPNRDNFSGYKVEIVAQRFDNVRARDRFTHADAGWLYDHFREYMVAHRGSSQHTLMIYNQSKSRSLNLWDWYSSNNVDRLNSNWTRQEFINSIMGTSSEDLTWR